MKKYLILLLLSPLALKAQRDGGDFSVSALGGISKKGYNAQFHVDYYVPYTYLMVQGRLLYINQNLPTVFDSSINLKQFGFSALLGWSPEKRISHPFFLNFLAGLSVGYDYGNNGNIVFSDYEMPFDTEKYNKLNYGFVTSVQGEINVSDKLSLMADFSQFYRFGSEFGKYTYTINGGFKIYL